jgi:hypothetical protein
MTITVTIDKNDVPPRVYVKKDGWCEGVFFFRWEAIQFAKKLVKQPVKNEELIYKIDS